MNIERGKFIKELVYNSKIKALIYSVSGEGITIRYDSGKIIRLSQQDGLASNFINQFYEDEQGIFWVATNQGINTLEFIEPEGVKIHSILNSSKLLNSPNILQIYNKDSMLYIGTDAGFNCINLRSIEQNKSIIVPLRIEGIEVNGLKKNDFTSLENLTYNQNNITFHYTALAFNQYGNIDYRYRIKGISDPWVYTKQRKVNFASILPGTYTFELEVQNEFGDWVRLDLLPKFTINKPYWKTWWFIGGGLLLGLFLISSILYYYISNLKREKAFLENEQLLSNELNESRQKALSSQLNPHFVFNSLNSIQNFILTKRRELSSDYLSMFSKLMRFVFENSKKLYVPLSDEIAALKLYLELEQVRHNHKFEYTINSGNLRAERIDIPSLLIQPIIENAIWHGLLHKLEENRLLEISFYEEGENLNIEIKDNGIGRGQSQPRPKFIKKQKSSGVELTQRRLSLLCQSTGLKTSFKVIDLYDKANNPSGTLVKITIPLALKSEERIHVKSH